MEVNESSGLVCAVPIDTAWTFRRLSPESEGGAALIGPDGPPDTVPANPSDLRGICIRPESGEVLLLGADGSFTRSLDGDLLRSPLDRGHFELTGENGRATMVFLFDGTGTCGAGDLEWSDMLMTPGDPSVRLTGAMDITAVTDSCGDTTGSLRYLRVVGA